MSLPIAPSRFLYPCKYFKKISNKFMQENADEEIHLEW